MSTHRIGRNGDYRMDESLELRIASGRHFPGDEVYSMRIRGTDGTVSPWLALSLPMLGAQVTLIGRNEDRRCHAKYNGKGRGAEYMFDFLRDAYDSQNVAAAAERARLRPPRIERLR